AERSRSTNGRFQVADCCIGAESDRMPRRAPAIREFAFEVVGDTNEVFIESTDFDGIDSPQRKIAAHESIDLQVLGGGELSCFPGRAGIVTVPRLQDPPGN